jgi:hypothetical protein
MPCLCSSRFQISTCLLTKLFGVVQRFCRRWACMFGYFLAEALEVFTDFSEQFHGILRA